MGDTILWLMVAIVIVGSHAVAIAIHDVADAVQRWRARRRTVRIRKVAR